MTARIPASEADTAEGLHLVLDPTAATDVLRELPSGRNVLAVLYEQSADAWRRRWRTEVGRRPAQQGLIEVTELTRRTATAAPTTQVLPENNVALTTAARPLAAETLSETVDQYLDGWADSESPTTVFVDSLGAVIDDTSVADATDVVRSLATRVAAIDAVGYVCLDDASTDPATVEAVLDAVETVRFDDSPTALEAYVLRLRREDPTSYGYLRRHWQTARRGIEATDRTYPQARQLHDVLDEPEASPRALGTALRALVTLGVIGVWGDTVGANRYDLTTYDPDRLSTLGAVLDRQPPSS